MQTPADLASRSRRSGSDSLAGVADETASPAVAPTARAASVPTHSEEFGPNVWSALERRGGPQFFLVDAGLNVLAASGGDGMDEFIRTAMELVASWVDAGSTLVPLVDDTFLRAIPLEGTWPGAKIIFVEKVRVRGGIPAAAKRFELTKRETEVLRLLISSKSNVEIARDLFIAHGTVGNHVKNIFRKMNSSHRTEVIAKLFGSPE